MRDETLFRILPPSSFIHMNQYILRKFGWALVTILFVVVLNFFLFRILPGDPARAVKDPRLTQQSIEAIQRRFGLDQPLYVQFFLYVRNLAQGDMGTSFHQQRPVTTILAESLGNTLLLIGAGTLFSILLGMALGIWAAWKAQTVIDYSVLVGSLVAWAAPTFWFGILLLFWGSSQWGLPIGGKLTVGMDYAGWWERWW